MSRMSASKEPTDNFFDSSRFCKHLLMMTSALTWRFSFDLFRDKDKDPFCSPGVFLLKVFRQILEGIGIPNIFYFSPFLNFLFLFDSLSFLIFLISLCFLWLMGGYLGLNNVCLVYMMIHICYIFMHLIIILSGFLQI